MASQLKNITLIGASGNIGKIILKAVVASPDAKVTVLSCSSSGATFVSDVKPDFSEAELESALRGQDAVTSAVAATGFVDQKKFIDASIRAGVKRFIPSEFSSNTLSDAAIQLVPLFEQKRVVLDYIKSKESEGLTWIGIATALLLDCEAVKKLGAGDFSGTFTLVRGTSYANTPGLRANYAKDEKLANGLL
ncbi:uncharacterized protein N7446_002196 [Penicillium canescens]|uniref:NmrA-like domain-containing protein n=1 Tax=Penicillium canescens TaxID=5083 RepID=A0AAD6IDM5_PENCN|nr:uncharacterized protein N7446_002196 [Penicillium canescens]KAJ6043999.1 hypothetical protein N7460_005354 [Penicillium canescens]KAJ6055472.1 hypothetical protein N7444_004570 [Penicillium canescens]KAJ6074419.1 hypothetical protein N7446_002196 [Penicillium canescens]